MLMLKLLVAPTVVFEGPLINNSGVTTLTARSVALVWPSVKME